MKHLLMFLLGIGFVIIINCSSEKKSMVHIDAQAFNKILDGKQAALFRLTNSKGCEAFITNYGAKLVALTMPDRNGELADVVLGFDTLDGYLAGSASMGATQGRYANRIAGAKFTLNGQEYLLAANSGANHIHGGNNGFRKVTWEARKIETDDGQALELKYLSKDGDEGYPGNLSVTLVYTLTEDNELKLDYTATTDRSTVLNLTHHSFFNLAGAGNGDIMAHEIMIYADHFLPTNSEMIPTGESRSVPGTPMDFTQSTIVGARINQDDDQLKFAGGYDHCYVLEDSGTLKLAARVHEPTSGRVMEVYTTEPAVQFYTGNSLNGSDIGKGGIAYQARYGFCLETQHFPDSPNQPHFPSTVLNPGETYTQQTIYKFTTQ